MPNWVEETKIVIEWTEEIKVGKIIITRRQLNNLTRAELATLLHGSPTATVTRKDLEDYFVTNLPLEWTEENKNTIEWL